ncbi:MAG: molybdopterin molybdenumtransferase MoeA, partial [Chloroflexota bacterium]
MTELLNVDDVIARILRDMLPLPTDPVPLLEALGRALAEDVHAGQDVPAFASSAMDGYAVRAADVAGASHERPARLRVVADIPAGVQPDMQLGPGEAARIMTGAPLPEGADAVIRVEDTGDRWVSDGLAALPETVDVFVAARPGTDVRQPG